MGKYGKWVIGREGDRKEEGGREGREQKTKVGEKREGGEESEAGMEVKGREREETRDSLKRKEDGS